MKTLAPPEQVRQSLLNLRNELWNNEARTSLVFKINSCLYSQYPSDGSKIELNEAGKQLLRAEA